jgi:hypothetical protein
MRSFGESLTSPDSVVTGFTRMKRADFCAEADASASAPRAIVSGVRLGFENSDYDRGRAKMNG